MIRLLCVMFLACSALHAQQLFVTSHPAMGTEFKLYLYADTAEHAGQISDAVYEEVDRIEDLLSNYRETSELSRINRFAAMEEVRTDPEMVAFLEQSQRWSSVSDGAFDITVGPLMQVWGFFHHQGKVPTPADLEQVRSVIGWKHIQLDEQAQTVHFDRKGVELDPGGIGKGFAVDAAVRVLKAWHMQAAMLSAGSSTLYALGAPPGEDGWKVQVTGPTPSHTLISTVLLKDASLSSANCSEKNFVQNGVLYCHIMNPQTLHPVVGRIQVAVIHPSATASDALSNVLFVAPPEKSFAVLRSSAAMAQALVLSRGSDGTVVCSTFHWKSPVSSLHCQIH